MEVNVTVVDFVLLSDKLHHLRVDFSEFMRRVEVASSTLGDLNRNFRFLSVQPDSDLIELSGQLFFLLFSLLGV